MWQQGLTLHNLNDASMESGRVVPCRNVDNPWLCPNAADAAGLSGFDPRNGENAWLVRSTPSGHTTPSGATLHCPYLSSTDIDAVHVSCLECVRAFSVHTCGRNERVPLQACVPGA